MKQIEIKILKYIETKNEDNPAVFPFLELHLMAKYKEREYFGVYLIQKVKDMDKEGLLKNLNTGIFITPKGLEYLRKNGE